MENDANISRFSEEGSNQNLRLFVRGKAISCVFWNIGIIQFPNPPIIIGMMVKKIMINACDVTIEL